MSDNAPAPTEAPTLEQKIAGIVDGKKDLAARQAELAKTSVDVSHTLQSLLEQLASSNGAAPKPVPDAGSTGSVVSQDATVGKPIAPAPGPGPKPVPQPMPALSKVLLVVLGALALVGGTLGAVHLANKPASPSSAAKTYAADLVAAHASALTAMAVDVRAGKALSDAAAAEKAAFLDGRHKAWAKLSTQLDAIIPPGTADKDVTADMRTKYAAALDGFVKGMGGK